MKSSPFTRLKPAIARWCQAGFVPQPAQGWEWFFMRLFLAVLVFYSLQEFKPYTFDEQSVPRGLARLFDLTFLHENGPIDFSTLKRLEIPMLGTIRLHGTGWFDTVVVLSAVLGALYVWGRGLLITLPLLALLHTIPWTFSNSQGYTHHGNQLVSMVLIVQAIVVWWWQIRIWRGKPRLPAGLEGHLIYYSQGMVALSYVACAITKIINSKGLWLWRSNNICIELIKSHRLEYYEKLSPELAGDPPAAIWLLNHPWTTRLLFDAGFFVELLAVIALRNRPWALLVGCSIIAFHRSVWVLMRLEFPMHEYLIAIFLVNVPFWVWWAAKGRRLPTMTSPPAHAAV
jgi:hypothetical protein